jgi:hypothetical protein
MLTHFGAKISAVGWAAARLFETRLRVSAAIAAVTLTLGGCLPATGPMAGADPADPGARVAGVGYRSTVAPYSSLRPSSPSPWLEQNDRAAPAPKSDR